MLKIFFALLLFVVSANSVLAANTCTGERCSTLRWWDSMLPENTYVASCPAPGVVKQDYQPLKTKVNYDLNQVYFRKSNVYDSYAGNIYTFDANNIYLYQETFGAPRLPGDTVWDRRYDRFRLFEGVAWGTGKIKLPRQFNANWNFTQLFNVYLCENFAQLNSKTCTLVSPNHWDSKVTMEIQQNFNAVFDADGELLASGLDCRVTDEFKHFDEVLIISQHQGIKANVANGTPENPNNSRERLFLARKGDFYYGVVRWDHSSYVDGQWVVDDRAVGVRRESSPFFSYADMIYKRVASDNLLKHAPKIPGDLNSDGRVDLFDYRQIVAKYGTDYNITHVNRLINNHWK